MFTKPNASSGIPIYVQIKDQIIHAIEKGVLKSGEQLPSVRTLAEKLVINPNTVIKIYRELELEGFIEIRHGSGAFTKERRTNRAKTEKINSGTQLVEKLIDELKSKGLSYDEIRRLIEAALQKGAEEYVR